VGHYNVSAFPQQAAFLIEIQDFNLYPELKNIVFWDVMPYGGNKH
jgi:hypothetical protein